MRSALNFLFLFLGLSLFAQDREKVRFEKENYWGWYNEVLEQPIYIEYMIHNCDYGYSRRGLKFYKEKDIHTSDDADYYKNPSIGRVVVSKKNRGKELGKKIMIYSIEYINKNLKGEKIELSAQIYLDKFYKDLGFYRTGEDYLEDGIPHQRMIKEIN